MKSIKLLLVDDESIHLDLSSEFLSKEDEKFDIDIATSAEEALDLIEEKEYDCIVSDYQMPSIDGLEFLERVRNELDMNIPFILFTGKGREEVAIEALNLGADRYLEKGGDPQSQFKELAHTIKQEVRHELVEERLKLTSYSIENADIGALWISPDGVINYSNKKICQSLGYSRGEMIGMTLSDIDPNYSNDRPEIWNEIKEKGSKTFESEHMTREGRTFPVRITSHYLKKNGEEYEFAFVRDISEQKEKNRELEKLSSIVKKSSEAIICTDTDFQITYMNPAAEDMFGYTLEEVEGKTPGIFNAEPDDKKIQEEIYDSVSAGKTYKNVLLNKRKDGSKFYCEMKVSPISDGDIEGYVSPQRDVTDRVKAKQRLLKYKRALENSGDIIAIADTDYKQVFVNEAFKKYFQVGDEEVVGKTIEETMGKDLFKKIKPRLDRCLEGERLHFENTRKVPGLGKRTLDIRYHPRKG